MTEPCWTPDPAEVAATRVTAFIRHVRERCGVEPASYDALWRWSIDQPEAFWRAVWDFADVIGEPGRRVLVSATHSRACWVRIGSPRPG